MLNYFFYMKNWPNLSEAGRVWVSKLFSPLYWMAVWWIIFFDLFTFVMKNLTILGGNILTNWKFYSTSSIATPIKSSKSKWIKQAWSIYLIFLTLIVFSYHPLQIQQVFKIFSWLKSYLSEEKATLLTPLILSNSWLLNESFTLSVF